MWRKTRMEGERTTANFGSGSKRREGKKEIWDAHVAQSMCTTDMSKSRRIGCVIPRCKLQCGITQPNLRLFDICVLRSTPFLPSLPRKLYGRTCTVTISIPLPLPRPSVRPLRPLRPLCSLISRVDTTWRRAAAASSSRTPRVYLRSTCQRFSSDG